MNENKTVKTMDSIVTKTVIVCYMALCIILLYDVVILQRVLSKDIIVCLPFAIISIGFITKSYIINKKQKRNNAIMWHLMMLIIPMTIVIVTWYYWI